MKKRYSIIRVDKFCPRDLERNYNLKCIGSLHCDKCDLKKKYGDTKKQMIKKVATAMKIAVKKATKKNIFIVYDEEKIPVCIFIENVLAKKIVEFLGVEE